MFDFRFAGRLFQAVGNALFWPERRALLVADLHFEKASWYARAGQLLPPYDSRATCEALTAIVERLDVAEIWALGDSFHDMHGPGRFEPVARAAVRCISQGRRFVWISGNHDEQATLPGEHYREASVDGIMLRHEAQANERQPEISGHSHPKIRVRTTLRSISRPCFVTDGQRLILPAFGALTGGLDVEDPAIAGLFAAPAEAMLPTADRLLRFPLAARQPAPPSRA